MNSHLHLHAANLRCFPTINFTNDNKISQNLGPETLLISDTAMNRFIAPHKYRITNQQQNEPPRMRITATTTLRHFIIPSGGLTRIISSSLISICNRLNLSYMTRFLLLPNRLKLLHHYQAHLPLIQKHQLISHNRFIRSHLRHPRLARLLVRKPQLSHCIIRYR